MKRALLTTVAALSILSLYSCNDTKEKSTTSNRASVAPMKLTDLVVSSQFILEPYTQKYTLAEGDSMYSISENRATYELNIVTNFNNDMVTDKEEVNTMPDVKKGEYARIAITSDSTISHQYKSYINEQPLITDLTLPITFEEGSFADYKAGKKCIVKHKKAGVEKLTKEFSWQILLEMTPIATKIINDYGFNMLTDKGKEPENVKRYILKDNYKITKSQLPSPVLTFEGGKCSYKNETKTEYEIDFTGDFHHKEDQ